MTDGPVLGTCDIHPEWHRLGQWWCVNWRPLTEAENETVLGTCALNESHHEQNEQCFNWSPLPVQTDEPPSEPVTVDACWQALCSRCGWHTPPTSPRSWVNEMAAAHRESCPNKEQMDVA